MTARNLKLVEPAQESRADIYAAWRADIAKRDWNAVHIAADRRGFFAMPEHRKWRYS
jgi:hypothetical protein